MKKLIVFGFWISVLSPLMALAQRPLGGMWKISVSNGQLPKRESKLPVLPAGDILG